MHLITAADVSSEVFTANYTDKYTAIPITSVPEPLASQLSTLYFDLSGFDVALAPYVVMAESGSAQKVYPSFVTRLPEGGFLLAWGGYSHKDLWLKVPTTEVQVDIADGPDNKPYKVAIIRGFGFPLQDVDVSELSGGKAGKLSDLAVGTYPIKALKRITCKAKDGKGSYESFVVVLQVGSNTEEFWANAQLSEILIMGVAVAIEKNPDHKLALRVISKGLTQTGRKSAKVGISQQ